MFTTSASMGLRAIPRRCLTRSNLPITHSLQSIRSVYNTKGIRTPKVWTRVAIQERILEMLFEYAQVPEQKISLDANLANALLIDSLDRFEFEIPSTRRFQRDLASGREASDFVASILEQCNRLALILRRAEPKDVSSILILTRDEESGSNISPVLIKRFGDRINIAKIIETSPLTIVATDSTETSVLGFCAFNNGPPESIDTLLQEDNSSESQTGTVASGDWESWINARYETKDIFIHNTKFLSFFACDPAHQAAFLDASLSTLFSLIPSVKNICYMLPEYMALFAPLSSPKYVPNVEIQNEESQEAGKADTKKSSNQSRHNAKLNVARRKQKKGVTNSNVKYFTEAPSKDNGYANAGWPFTLQVCSRKEVFSPLKVRRARVEDCDDLLPMFKKQNLLHGRKADHYLADLLESKNDSSKTLVAEVDGIVVGFMSLTKDADQELLAKSFELDAFDNCQKEVPPELLKQVNMEPKQEDFGFDSNGAAKAAAAAAAQAAAIQAAITLRAQSNIFCISLLCIEDAYANQAIEFVRAAFALFPDRDYCVVTVPTTLPEIPLLRSYTAVPSKPGKSVSHCLYILHRAGIAEILTVRRSKEEDTSSVADLVKGLRIESDIMSKFRDSAEEGAKGAHFSTHQLVGIALLQKCPKPAVYIDQFKIEEFIDPRVTPLSDGPVVLRHMIINPLFSHQAKWFIEEIMRATGTSLMLYPVDEHTKFDGLTRKLAGKELIPVKRRRQIIFKDDLRDGHKVEPLLPFNLQIISAPFLYEPKITINSRIVVVGGSDVGIAFLERLVYSPHLHFTNITLISTAGVPEAKNSQNFVDYLCLDHYVQVIKASTTEFDRVLKRVRLDNDAYVMYDYLFLTPDVQFLASSISEQLGQLQGVYNLNRQSLGVIDKATAEFVAEQAEGASESVVVVYGRDLQVYASIQGLLAKGVKPTSIILAIPPLKQCSSCFDNDVVEKKVHDELEKVGVTILKGYKMINWDAKGGERIASVCLWKKEDKSERIIDNVQFVLYGDEKSVDPDTFKSINDACLVFDGLLVIDKYFRTQDPYIYAAGSISKYSSKYQTKWSHKYYDSKEVGQKLAETIMPLLDPTWLPTPLIENTELLSFRDAKKVSCTLPGGLNYLHFDEPRLPSHTLQFRRKLENYGRDLIIDNPQSGYFRIHVDTHGYIRSLTYLGYRKIPIDNYLCLYGLHEKYLNRLVSRFDEGIIPDIVSFLDESWAYPIYHDNFTDFTTRSRKEMLSRQGGPLQDLIERLQDLGSTGEKIDPDHTEDIFKKFGELNEKKIWDAEVHQFYLQSKVCVSFP
ncbi:hypothetical protein HDV05_002404 [Chytridiales sp. JEL 0842]|nr:hypothetical protein HDV05_002404 [Chytridiales sp. JEL 0842]